MALSHLPASVANAFGQLAHWLDRRSAARLPILMLGMLFASHRRTVTSWFRAAGITVEFRQGYVTVCAVGRRFEDIAISTVLAVKPLLPRERLLLAIDDTPTSRYGPLVEGCGIHHNPCPGPAGEKFLYGHVWVTLAALARHEELGHHRVPSCRPNSTSAGSTCPSCPPNAPATSAPSWRWPSSNWSGSSPGWRAISSKLWVVVDGGYAKRPFLRGAKEAGFTVVSRLRKDAALYSLPEPKPAGQARPPSDLRQGADQPGQAGGPDARLGAGRVRAIRRGGDQDGQDVPGDVWRPAGGIIRVVLVKEEEGWIPFFSPNPGGDGGGDP